MENEGVSVGDEVLLETPVPTPTTDEELAAQKARLDRLDNRK